MMSRMILQKIYFAECAWRRHCSDATGQIEKKVAVGKDDFCFKPESLQRNTRENIIFKTIQKIKYV